jgi:hypothetical protein
MVGLTRQQVSRLASAGKIPGTKWSKGGHAYFVECPKLGGWIADRRDAVCARRVRRERQVRQARLTKGMQKKLEPIEAIQMAYGLEQYMAQLKSPITRWHKAQVDALRENLLPLAKLLWPQKLRDEKTEVEKIKLTLFARRASRQ